MEILEHIWSETLEFRTGDNLPPLASILGSVLAAPMVCFATKNNRITQPCVGVGSQEVMPGATLADVLFEEFSIEVSDDTIILIEPLRAEDALPLTSQEFGQLLGQTLVDLAGLGQPRHAAASVAAGHGFAAPAAQPEAAGTTTELVQ